MTKRGKTSSGERWLGEFKPDQSVDTVARQILKRRYRNVDKRIKQVLSSDAADPRQVHKLRVATRRAAAATRVFGDLMDSKKARAARRELRKIRRAAGDARRIDVQLDMLANRNAAGHETAIAFVLESLRTRQTDARDRMIRAAKRRGKKHYQRIGERLARRVKPRQPSSLSEFADVTMRSCFSNVQQDSSADLTVLDHVHELRISAKRLRYAAELFVSCASADTFAQNYEKIVAIQDRLGTINDLHELANLVAEIEEQEQNRSSGNEATVTALAAYRSAIEEELMRRHGEFLRWWTPETVDALRTSNLQAFSQLAADEQQKPTPQPKKPSSNPAKSTHQQSRKVSAQRQGGPVS